MKKLLLLLLLLLNFYGYSQEKKCSDYKIGSFTYSNPLYKNWKVIRTQTEQLEIDEENKIKLQALVNWVSDCEYNLTYTKVNDSIENPIIGKKLNVKIIKVNDNSIICKSSGLGIELEFEMLLKKN